jgi:hypothetical protein
MSPVAQLHIARANRGRADEHLASNGREVGRPQGFPSIGRLVEDKLAAGKSLAAISRENGLSKDWMSRHLQRLDPFAAELARSSRRDIVDARLLPVIRGFGFEDVASYLRRRHLGEHASVNAIACEVGLSFHAVKSALQRHKVTISPHAATRHMAGRREQQVASDLGVESIPDYIRRCRTLGWTWRQIAIDSGQPETWLRRRASG